MSIFLSVLIALSSTAAFANGPVAPLPVLSDAHLSARVSAFDRWVSSALPPGIDSENLRARVARHLVDKAANFARTPWFLENHDQARDRDRAFNATMDEYVARASAILRTVVEQPESARTLAVAQLLAVLTDVEVLIAAYTPGRDLTAMVGAVMPFALTSLVAMFVVLRVTIDQPLAVREAVMHNMPWIMAAVIGTGAAVPGSLAAFEPGRRLLSRMGGHDRARSQGQSELESRFWTGLANRIDESIELKHTLGTSGDLRSFLSSRLIFLTDVSSACEAWLAEGETTIERLESTGAESPAVP